MSFCTTSSSNLRTMRRLTANSVFSGLVTAWRLAGCPTSTSLSFVKATIEGVVRSPSLFSITRGLPPSMMATHELVVPRSMPITFAMGLLRQDLFQKGDDVDALSGCSRRVFKARDPGSCANEAPALGKRRGFCRKGRATDHPGWQGPRPARIEHTSSVLDERHPAHLPAAAGHIHMPDHGVGP